jgi:hypothetical protein
VFVDPSLYTTVNGPVPPVIVTTKFALLPEHTVAVPLNTELVAGIPTVTVALPDKPALGQLFASVTDTNVYVFVDAGLTEMFAPLL